MIIANHGLGENKGQSKNISVQVFVNESKSFQNHCDRAKWRCAHGFSWQSSPDSYCARLQQQIWRNTSKDGDTLIWRMLPMVKHLQLRFVNDLVLSLPCRHVVLMQFFTPISAPFGSQRNTLIEPKFSKKWLWLKRNKTTELIKWGPTGPRPIMTRSMNGEIDASMTAPVGIQRYSEALHYELGGPLHSWHIQYKGNIGKMRFLVLCTVD